MNDSKTLKILIRKQRNLYGENTYWARTLNHVVAFAKTEKLNEVLSNLFKIIEERVFKDALATKYSDDATISIPNAPSNDTNTNDLVHCLLEYADADPITLVAHAREYKIKFTTANGWGYRIKVKPPWTHVDVRIVDYVKTHEQ